jgi:hypothetical protein
LLDEYPPDTEEDESDFGEAITDEIMIAEEYLGKEEGDAICLLEEVCSSEFIVSDLEESKSWF